MNELPVIGSLCFRKDFWERHGENIATRQKEMYGERLFRGPNKNNYEERSSLFRRCFIRIGLGNVDTREA